MNKKYQQLSRQKLDYEVIKGTARPAKSEFFANISLTIGFIKILSIPYEVQLLIPQLYAL